MGTFISKFRENPNYVNSLSPTGLESTPYIALYNKFSGVIRLFFRIHDQNSIGGNAVRVNLKFDDPLNVSGQLRYYNSGTVALNQQTKVIEASTISFLSPYSLSWASVDFVMAYDPCVCSHPSKLKFEFEKISTSSKVIKNYNNNSEALLALQNFEYNVFQNRNYLPIFDNSTNDSDKGLVFSKKLSNYIEALVPYFIALNEKEEDILSYSLDVIKEIETNGNLPTNYWNSFLSNPTFAAELNNIGVILTSQQGQLIVDTDKLLLLCKETILRNQDNTVLTNNFVKDEIDEAPTLTAGSTQDMSFGGITTGSPTSEFSFYTPGNHGTTATLNAALIAPHSPLEYPIYNEVLGIFALLNTPRVLVSRTVHDYSNNYSNVDKKGITYRNTWNNDKRLHFTFKGHQEWSQKYQVKIIDNIEYALNDVLNIKSCKIKASIELAGTPVGYNNLSVNFPHNNSNGALVGYAFSDPAYFSNIEKSNIPMTGYEPLVEKCSGNDYQEYVGTIPFMKLGGLQQCSPNAQQPTNILLPPYHLRTTVKYSSPFTDIDELNSLVMGFGLKNEVMEFKYDTYQDPTLISQLQTNGSYVIPIIN